MKPRLKIAHGFQLICLIGLLSGNSCQKTNIYEDYSWTTKIRDDHPRLFFNNTSFQKIKERALNEEQDIFEEMKNRVDLLIGQKIEFKEPLVHDGTQNTDHEYGTRAAEAAFVYLVLKDKKYLSLSKELLVSLIDYYNLRNEANLNIQWFAFSRINALAAYDWIYNDLTEKERTDIGGPLLYAINNMLPSEKRKSVFRKNSGGPTTGGFYGPRCLSWYAGLVFYEAEINDSLSEELLLKGYDDYTALLKHRSNIAGDDGGAASAVLLYCMGNYPWAEFNFFHTFSSATGLNISEEWPYVPGFINYILWNWLPGDREFGYGDTRHYTNSIPLGAMHIHLSQMIHFYGKTQPDLISLAKWMLTKVQKRQQEVLPFTRFLLTGSFDQIKPKGPSESTLKARYFENMGQIFMRSGPEANDTYALFTAGGILSQHRHYDNNNFVIFKQGFLALDAGTRPEPGLHLTHYYCRSIAHNCILINMPGEIMPNYWGGPAKSEKQVAVPNDGGQSELMGSEIIAFDENEQYVYIASDATKSYDKDKSNLVLRQFVFLPPDHFVIFDRVRSSKPGYKKTWLLHTAAEPLVKSNEFLTDHWEGRLYCKTLFPEKVELKKIGGPGKQFWSDGKNWSLPTLGPDDWNYRRMHLVPDTHELLGQWRIEVTPDKPDTDDIFLHLIQVGDSSLKSMANSSAIKTDDMIGVRFVYEHTEYEVMFVTKNEAGGNISIRQNGQIILEEKFTDKVKPQKGS